MTSEYEPTPQRLQVRDRALPVVLMFQPTVFEFVSGDRLQEWEQAMRERVFHGAVEVRSGVGTMAATWSGCPTFDECDQLMQ